MKKLLRIIEHLHPWTIVLWVVISSVLSAALLNSIQSMLFWGEVSGDLLIIGTIDSIIIAFILGYLIVFYGKHTTQLEKITEELRTENKNKQKAYEALLASDARFRIIADASQDMIHLNDAADGRIIYANKATERLLGYPLEDIIHTPAPELIHPDDRILIGGDMQKAFKGMHIPLREIRMKKRDGTYLDVEVAGFFVPKKEGISYIGAVLRDISARKEYELQRRDLETKAYSQANLISLGQISTGIAHEINQPLSYIRVIFEATLQDIEKGKLDVEEMRSDFTEALRQVLRIRDITGHLRTFGYSGETECTSVELKSVFDNTLLLLDKTLQFQNIQTHLDIEGTVPTICANSSQLEQVFINLFQNSIDAMAGKTTGEIQVKISSNNDRVEVRFSDNGHGVPAGLAARIFEPFYTTKEVGSGTGLGLSIVYGIVKEHKGAIRCESEPGAGATFIMDFPAEAGE
jgi:PAS domain S-box-containing protein